MSKILVCGEHSFVGSGLAEKLQLRNHQVDVFSRGEEGRSGNAVRGAVTEMERNPHFAEAYDAVVNFIFINKGTIEENLRYAESLHRFCVAHRVRRLILISSISVYSNAAEVVDECSAVEGDAGRKGPYAVVKIAVDNYFRQVERSYEVVIARLGYVVSDEREVRFGGIVKSLFPHFGILLGDGHTSLPLVEKAKVHEGLIRIIEKEKCLETYLMLEEGNGTKMDLVRRYWKGWVIPLPRELTLLAVRALKLLHVFSAHQLELVKGLFKRTHFDPRESEYDLRMNFRVNSVGVIGAGAYGSYAVQCLSEAKSRPAVFLYEVGGDKVCDEASVGYGSNIIGAPYRGLQKGRYFGKGGASAKWGGQLLFFSANDFREPTSFMRGIVDLDTKYSGKVLARFGFRQHFIENRKSCGMFTKTGIWLGYFHRNLFKWFGVARKVTGIYLNTRIVSLEYDREGGKIQGVTFRTHDGKIGHAYYDRYILAAGAFESNRIVLSSDMSSEKRLHFSDQLSRTVFRMKDSLVIDGEDYQFAVSGSSLVTKRLVGEIEDVSYFVHPVYNNDFPFFQGLKEILFQGKRSLKIIWNVCIDIPSVMGFAWSMLVKHKIYVYKGEWSMNIDIENKSDETGLELSHEMDAWGIPKLNIDFKVGPQCQKILEEVAGKVRTYLDGEGVTYSDIDDEIHVEKFEDGYHPYGMFMSDSKDVEDYFTRYPNMLIVNTGVLPRAGGLNTTAACFPLIEEYVNRYF